MSLSPEEFEKQTLKREYERRYAELSEQKHCIEEEMKELEEALQELPKKAKAK